MYILVQRIYINTKYESYVQQIGVGITYLVRSLLKYCHSWPFPNAVGARRVKGFLIDGILRNIKGSYMSRCYTVRYLLEQWSPNSKKIVPHPFLFVVGQFCSSSSRRNHQRWTAFLRSLPAQPCAALREGQDSTLHPWLCMMVAFGCGMCPLLSSEWNPNGIRIVRARKQSASNWK